MENKVEEGIDWESTIARIEGLPRGESIDVEIDSDRHLYVVHKWDGGILAQIDKSGHWIRPNTLSDLAQVLRAGVAKRARS